MKTESRLTKDTVADHALALADAEGFDALTIRRLAQDLGVTPMALYWHFKNKDELLYGVLDRLWAQIDVTRDRSRPLVDQFRALLESLVTVLRKHRAVVPLMMGPRDGEPCPAFLDATETALEILVEAGMDLPMAVAICQNAVRTAAALVMGEPGAADPQLTPDQVEAALRRKRLALETLPTTRYPLTVQGAVPLTSCDDPDAHYRFGIDFFMAGVQFHCGST